MAKFSLTTRTLADLVDKNISDTRLNAYSPRIITSWIVETGPGETVATTAGQCRPT
jgi:hypothetical protein